MWCSGGGSGGVVHHWVGCGVVWCGVVCEYMRWGVK